MADPTLFAIPLFVVAIVAEWLWLRHRARASAYELRDTATSLGMGIGSVIAGTLTAGTVAALMAMIHAIAPWNWGWSWWIWPICFVLDDLAYYLFHRSAHRVRWFWAAHVNHHSSQHYNLSTALRQSWTGFVALAFLFRFPLVSIGFEPGMVLMCAGINLIYQFWIHTEAIDRMPRWFEAVMNTPSHHRVHHAINPRYLDRNFGGTFVVWDRLFGTFQAEDADEPIRYGIVHQLDRYHLLHVAFHEWGAIGRDVWRAPWRHKWNYIWREPGWSHDGTRETSAMIRRRAGID